MKLLSNTFNETRYKTLFLYQNGSPESNKGMVSDKLDEAVTKALQATIKETRTLKELVEAKNNGKESLAEELTEKLETRLKESFQALNKPQENSLFEVLKTKLTPKQVGYIKKILQTIQTENFDPDNSIINNKPEKPKQGKGLSKGTEIIVGKNNSPKKKVTSKETTDPTPEINKEEFKELQNILKKYKVINYEKILDKTNLTDEKKEALIKQFNTNKDNLLKLTKISEKIFGNNKKDLKEINFESLSTQQKEFLNLIKNIVSNYQQLSNKKTVSYEDSLKFLKEFDKTNKEIINWAEDNDLYQEETDIDFDKQFPSAAKSLAIILNKLQVKGANPLYKVIIRQLETHNLSIKKLQTIDASKVNNSFKKFICKIQNEIEKIGLVEAIKNNDKSVPKKVQTILDNMKGIGEGPLNITAKKNSMEYREWELKLAKEALDEGVEDDVAAEYVKYRLKKNGSLNFKDWYQSKIDSGEIVENTMDKLNRKFKSWGRMFGKLFGAILKFIGKDIEMDWSKSEYEKKLKEALENAKQSESALESWEGEAKLAKELKMFSENPEYANLYKFLKPVEETGKVIGSKGISAEDFKTFKTNIQKPKAKQLTAFMNGKNKIANSNSDLFEFGNYNEFQDLLTAINHSETRINITGTPKTLAVTFEKNGEYRTDDKDQLIRHTLKNSDNLSDFINNMNETLKDESPKHNGNVKPSQGNENGDNGNNEKNNRAILNQFEEYLKENVDFNGTSIGGGETESREKFLEQVKKAIGTKNVTIEKLKGLFEDNTIRKYITNYANIKSGKTRIITQINYGETFWHQESGNDDKINNAIQEYFNKS